MVIEYHEVWVVFPFKKETLNFLWPFLSLFFLFCIVSCVFPIIFLPDLLLFLNVFARTCGWSRAYRVSAVDAGLVLGHPGPRDPGAGAGLQAADRRRGLRVRPAAPDARALRLDQEEEAHRRCVWAWSRARPLALPTHACCLRLGSVLDEDTLFNRKTF